jgi:DNA-binding MarR family transcriptional regulator
MPTEAPTLTIARLSRLLESHSASDMTLSQYRVLGILSTGDERASLLAARLTVAKPTLTALVDSLVERGYVARESSADDRRAVRLSITDGGRSALADTERHLADVLDDVLACSDDPDGLVRAIEQIGVALDRRWARLRDQEADRGAVR